MTVFLYTFTEREKIYNLIEQLTGARFTTSYTRIGGLTRDLPEAFIHAAARSSSTKSCRSSTRWTSCSRAIASSSTARKDVGVISKEDAIAYGSQRPEPARLRRRSRSAQGHPYLGYEKYEFDVPIGTVGDCYDRYLVRMEEMRQSVRILRAGRRERCPTGRSTCATPSRLLPPKDDVLTKMEELIHHFILVTEGIDAPPGEVYFGAENPKGELGFYIYSKGGGVPYRLKIRAPSFVNLSILSEDPARPHDQRRRHHPRLARLRDGRVRPVAPSPRRGLAWRPLHLAAAEEMNVKVGHAFAGVAPVVDDDAVSISCNPLPLGDRRRCEQQMTE